MEKIKWLTLTLLILLSLGESCSALKNFFKKKKLNSQKRQFIPVQTEENMSTPEMILNRKYPVEIHHVTTSDGYILELHRIPYGRNETSSSSRTSSRKPVFLQHGILGSSSSWTITPSERGLPYLLADQGYDVWLGNYRGNTYSRNHTTLKPDEEEFWLFTYDEMGMYDIPACINYILEQTGQEKLSYVGHSMGTTGFWIAMITHPELNDKIEVMIGLAPVAIMAHLRSIVRFAAPVFDKIILYSRLKQTRAFLAHDGLFGRMQQLFCNKLVAEALICRSIIFLIFGSDPSNFDPEFIPLVDGHDPAGTSIYTVAHYAQSYNAGEIFMRYDWGRSKNLQIYNQTTPPEYDLSKVTAPVYIFWGQNDLVSTPEDVAWLATRLKNLRDSVRVDFDEFNHMDFLWANKVKELVYDKLFTFLPGPS